MPTGERVYVLKYRISSAQRWYTIGRHGSPWTPDEARKEAVKLLGDVARGVDPAGKRNADRAALSFGELCDVYLREGTAHKKASTIRADRGRVEIHLKPLLGKKRADAISRDDVERLLSDVKAGKISAPASTKRGPGSVAKGGPGVAGQCVALLSTILQFAVDRKIRADNPARGVKKPSVRKIERFLSAAEISRLAEALDAEARHSNNPYPASAIKLLLLTGCPKGEIANLCWVHVDFERLCIRLSDSKTGAKVIYLNSPSRSLLKRLPRVAGSSRVFPGVKANGASIDKVWGRVRNAADLRDVRLHDLRHTFASIGVEASLGLPIIGKLLGHTQAQTTARYAHLSADPVRSAADTIGAAIAAAMKMDADAGDR
jgi:site-specific recombinase XerD